MENSGPTIIQWILDTRELWKEATQTKHLETVASRALSLLTEAEQAAVLKYYHVRDAKLSLGSHLLKRYVISKYCRVPWKQTTITRDARTKPIFRDAEGNTPLAFNISHQAGLVALLAVHGYPHKVEVGVDIVSPPERRERDQRMVAADGWAKFVDVHADVLGEEEVKFLKFRALAAISGLKPRSTVEEIVDFKLRVFYALWCLREAFVKMTGEALLAEWLGQLEFRVFRPPGEGDNGFVKDFDVWWKGKKVDDVALCLRDWGEEYMTCTAISTPERVQDGLGFEVGEFQEIDIENILEFAEAQM